MKKFALLLGGLAVVGTASAKVPETAFRTANLERVVNESQVVKHTSKEVVGNHLATKSISGKKVQTRAEGSDPFSVGYKEPSQIMTFGLSMDHTSVVDPIRLGANYVPMTFTNTSTGLTEWQWEVPFYVGQDEISTKTYDTWDYTETFPFDRNMTAPTLLGVGAGEDEIEEYKRFDGTLWYQWGYKPSILFSGDAEATDLGVTPDMNTALLQVPEDGHKYSSLVQMGYSTDAKYAYAQYFGESGLATSLVDILTTTDDPEDEPIATDPQFVGYAQIYPEMARPYFITKLWAWVSGAVKRTTTIELTLYKIDEEGYITDEVIAKGECNWKKGFGQEEPSKMVLFELHTVDENGLETDDAVVIEGAFAAYMRFKKEDFSRINTVTGTGNQFEYMVNGERQRSPYPSYSRMLLKDGNAEDSEEFMIRCPWLFDASDEDENLVFDPCCWAWMIDATYDWIEIVDGGSNVGKIPAEGGEVSFEIDSFYYTDRLPCYVDTEDYKWVDFAWTESEEGNQVLTCSAEALPEGVEGRSVTFWFVGVTSELEIKIEQGDVSGVNVITTSHDVKYFDLTGRQVANPEKGIYIKVANGKAQKVIF